MIKKISAITLSLLMMTTSFSISANAENTEVINNSDKFQVEMEVTSNVIVPCINVVVPTTAHIVFNPYQIPFDVDGNTDQVISTDINIINNSTSPVEVELVKAPHTASTTGTDKAKPWLTSYSISETTTSKYISLFLKNMDSSNSMVNINDVENRSYDFGQLDVNETMNLKFTGSMAKKATWTGDESVTIKPIFKIRALTE